jgi:hypothetical protein
MQLANFECNDSSLAVRENRKWKHRVHAKRGDASSPSCSPISTG